jgi:hypothetical protein
MPDSDYMPRKRSMFPFIMTILIIHFVFAFATIFIMYFFSLFMSPSAAQTVGSVVSIVLFFSMLYSESWRAGQQDRNLMKFGHLEDDKFRGLKSALYAQIPGVLLAVLAILHRLTGGALPAFMLAGYKLFYEPFVDIIWLLDQISPVLYILVPIIPPIFVHIGYSLGFKGYMISEKVVYKKKPEINRERKFK